MTKINEVSEVMIGTTEYLKAIQQALAVSLGNSDIYTGRTGALRLAREIGSCLNDFQAKEAEQGYRNSYNYVCVIGYSLNPPVDKREWDAEVKSKMKASVSK